MWRKKHRQKLSQRINANYDALRWQFENGLDSVKSSLDVPPSMYDAFWQARQSEAYQLAFTMEAPLVTVCTATYNRPDMLLRRAIPSVLGQSYRNIEYLVVGDGSDPEAYAGVASVDDPRLRFVNLPERGVYPRNPELRWMVAGTAPMNEALRLARGQFITHLDDDDVYEATRIEKLVAFAQERRLDFVWHPFYSGSDEQGWTVHPAESFLHGDVTNSGVLYHSWLNAMPFDSNAYRLREPGDWNRFRKFKHIGVRAERYPEPLLYHYEEGSLKRNDEE